MWSSSRNQNCSSLFTVQKIRSFLMSSAVVWGRHNDAVCYVGLTWPASCRLPRWPVQGSKKFSICNKPFWGQRLDFATSFSYFMSKLPFLSLFTSKLRHLKSNCGKLRQTSVLRAYSFLQTLGRYNTSHLVLVVLKLCIRPVGRC